jgi:hypothetical protein
MSAYQNTIDDLARANHIRIEYIPKEERHNSEAYPKSHRVRIPKPVSPETTIVGLEEIAHVKHHQRNWEYLPVWMREIAAKTTARDEFKRRGLPGLASAEAELRRLFHDRRLKDALAKGKVSPTELRHMAPTWLFPHPDRGDAPFRERVEATPEADSLEVWARSRGLRW